MRSRHRDGARPLARALPGATTVTDAEVEVTTRSQRPVSGVAEGRGSPPIASTSEPDHRSEAIQVEVLTLHRLRAPDGRDSAPQFVRTRWERFGLACNGALAKCPLALSASSSRPAASPSASWNVVVWDSAYAASPLSALEPPEARNVQEFLFNALSTCQPGSSHAGWHVLSLGSDSFHGTGAEPRQSSGITASSVAPGENCSRISCPRSIVSFS